MKKIEFFYHGQFTNIITGAASQKPKQVFLLFDRSSSAARKQDAL
jgi:hypothetical protein